VCKVCCLQFVRPLLQFNVIIIHKKVNDLLIFFEVKNDNDVFNRIQFEIYLP